MASPAAPRVSAPALSDAATRQRFAEALARRAGLHTGAARERIEARLEQIASTPATPAPARTPMPAGTPAASRSALGQLADRLTRQGLARTGIPTGLPAATHEPPEPSTLDYFRRTWLRLDADRRLAQALAEVPENAGPINSQQLVHRALVLMNQLSPAYLRHFLAHADALLWLDDHARGAPPAAATPRAEGSRRARGKAG